MGRFCSSGLLLPLRLTHTSVCHVSTSQLRPNIFDWDLHNQSHRKWMKWFNIDTYLQPKRKFVNLIANRLRPERILQMGPDFACLEWLMNAGSTSVLMSDGTVIKSKKEMEAFLNAHGFDLRKLKAEAPSANLLKDIPLADASRPTANDILYNEKWRHISPIHLKEVGEHFCALFGFCFFKVDASDSVITDEGFAYFLECRSIEKLRLNFCDYFGDDAISRLAQGRQSKTLKELELVFNPHLSDASVFLLTKLKSLQRLHLYFLPYVSKRQAMLRQLKVGLPKCNVTFPETIFIGMGYETEEQRQAYKATRKKGKGFFSKFFD